MRALLPILLLSLATPAEAGPSIHVRAAAEVASPVVRLGDVAKLSGFAADARRRFAAIELGRAPSPGAGALLPKAYVEGKLRDAGVGPGVRLKLPRRVEVTRKSDRISGDTLRARVEAAVRGAMPHDPDDVAELSVPRLSDLSVPAGSALSVEFEPGERFDGSTTAELRITDRDGTLVRARRVSVKVDTFVEAWGVRAVMPRNSRLTAADLVPLRLPASEVPRDAVREPRHVENAQVRRALSPGEPLRAAWLKVPPMVERRDRVRMVAVRGGIRITATGEAMDAAGRGETVRVRNLNSKRIVSGVVVGPNTVEMEF